MLVPRTSTEITKEWLSEILQNHEQKVHGNDCFLTVENFIIERGANYGEYFNGELSTLNVTSRLNRNNIEEEVKHYLYLKFHSVSSFSREINKFNSCHLKELKIYSEVKEILNRFSAIHYEVPPRLCLPEYYYGYTAKDDFVLVMKNMKTIEFQVNNIKNGLNYHQLTLVVEQLAIWHGLSYAFNLTEDGKKMNLPKLFQPNPQIMQTFKYSIETGITNAALVLKDKDEYKDIANLLTNPTPIYREFERLVINDTYSGVRCLVHGDMWNNNILLKYADREESIPIEVCLIDWQMSTWARAVFDLHYLLYSSTSYKVRQSHTDDLLRSYYDIFITLAGPTLHDYTYETFSQEYNDTKILGFIWGLILSQGSLSEVAGDINKRTNSLPSVRGFRFNLKKTLVAKVVSIILKPKFSFLMEPKMKKILQPIAKEIEAGNNKLLNTKLLEIFKEAKESKLLQKIYYPDVTI